MSPSLDRRQFLGSTLGSTAAAVFGSAFAGGAFLGLDLHAADQKNEDKAPKAVGPASLFLTWPGDPTSTVCIQWVDRDRGRDTFVEYAPWTPPPSPILPAGAPAWQRAAVVTKPFPLTDDKVYRCSIAGLRPGTEYQFRIGSDPGVLRFRTMPAKITDTFNFVSGGDAGTGEHAVRTNQLAARQEPYFTLMAGDLAYDNGKSPKTFRRFLENYRAHMVDPVGRLIPMISTLGNHEVDGSYLQPRDKAPSYLSVFDGFYRDTTYGVFDIGEDFSLVLLDTGHIAPVGGEQTAWLERTLAERQEKRHLFVAGHVPAYPSYREANIGGDKPGTGAAQRQHWCPLFERYNVDVVLEHHDHMFKRSHPLLGGLKDKNGILYLGDGSWGQLRVPKEPLVRPYLAKMSQAYHMTAHHLEGDERYHIALEETGRISDVCMTRSKRAMRG